MTTAELDAIAWRDFLMFAISDRDIRAEFESATKMRLPAYTGIEGMIDDATGYKDSALQRFVEWATETYWGPMPELVKQKLAEQERPCLATARR